MKVFQALMPLVAATAMLAGCESRSSAQVIIGRRKPPLKRCGPTPR